MFTSDFWHWYIVLPTALGIALLTLFFWLMWDPFNRSEEPAKSVGHVWDEDLEELDNPLPAWWSIMFFISVAFSVGYLVLFPGMGTFKGIIDWTQLNKYELEMDRATTKMGDLYHEYLNTPIPELAKNRTAVKIGSRLYSNYCVSCHGVEAEGHIAFPDLRDNDWLYGGTPEAIKASIMNGRHGIMLPVAQLGVAEENAVERLTQYVLKLSDRDYDEATAVIGEQLFSRTCIACHGQDGKGVSALGGPNLTDDIWLHGGQPSQIADVIQNGRQNMMPAQGAFLGDEKVHLLTAYIYSLSYKGK
ncbi:MAG: cytochrome-c oxidase, cbb3-type subunit III [Pseudomonadota bacterium]